MRFGLVGNGYWAQHTQGAVLSEHAGIELVGVWGREPTHVAPVAEALGTRAFTDYAALLEEVDAVSFAVAPKVQGDLALKAAAAGKHLLLDKPLCLSSEVADQLVQAATSAGVASVVFFTSRFSDAGRRWLADVAGGGWRGGWARFIVNAFAPESPYSNSPWRREKGALWDVGPHALSILVAALGPITGVRAQGGQGDLVHLILEHQGGLTSTATLTLAAPDKAINVEMALWGESGLTTLPRDPADPKIAYARALDELVHNASTGQTSHPCDVRFGAAIVHALAQAEQQVRGVS